MKISIKRRGDYKHRHLYQARIDACEFLRSTRRNVLAETLYKFFEFLKYSNINHTCPYDVSFIRFYTHTNPNKFYWFIRFPICFFYFLFLARFDLVQWPNRYETIEFSFDDIWRIYHKHHLVCL